MEASKGFCHILTLFILLIPLINSSTIPLVYRHIEVLEKENFDDFLDSPMIRVVHFYWKDITRLKLFFNEYDRAASLLSNYNVRLGMVNCKVEDLEYCKKKNVQKNVYAFRDKQEMLDLPLENMFDVNSIMSNILQLVLLKEVPIIQEKQERKDLENRFKGKQDIFFTFHSAIGTYEHR